MLWVPHDHTSFQHKLFIFLYKEAWRTPIHITTHLCYTLKLRNLLDILRSLLRSMNHFEISATMAPLLILFCCDASIGKHPLFLHAWKMLELSCVKQLNKCLILFNFKRISLYINFNYPCLCNIFIYWDVREQENIWKERRR